MLADAVVALRPWRTTTLPGMLGFADPLVHRFSWPHARPYTEADARAYLASLARGDELGFALVEPGRDAAVLGGASLYDHEPAQARARIGYWLVADGRGRGLATHAVRLLADWAFAELGLARLEITCAPGNLRRSGWPSAAGSCARGDCASHMRFKGGRRDTVVFGRVT